MKVHYNIYGKIVEGNNSGWYVKFIDDRDDTGGFYIYESKEPSGNDGYNNWLETENDVKGYISESGWKIDWSPD